MVWIIKLLLQIFFFFFLQNRSCSIFKLFVFQFSIPCWNPHHVCAQLWPCNIFSKSPFFLWCRILKSLKIVQINGLAYSPNVKVDAEGSHKWIKNTYQKGGMCYKANPHCRGFFFWFCNCFHLWKKTILSSCIIKLIFHTLTDHLSLIIKQKILFSPHNGIPYIHHDVAALKNNL